MNISKLCMKDFNTCEETYCIKYINKSDSFCNKQKVYLNYRISKEKELENDEHQMLKTNLEDLKAGGCFVKRSR